jgi:ABC-2 type transport system permease protein
MTALAGTAALARLFLRRDRLKLLIYVVVVGVIPMAMAASYKALYPTAAGLQAFADLSMSTPATVGMLGLIYAPTVGALTAWRAGLNGIFFIAPVSILLMVRYTRAEEAAGRRELLGGSVVGRQAPLTAALIVVCGVDLLLGVFIAAGLMGLGLPSAGALVMGLSAAAAGWVFAALAAVTAQLTVSPGPARGLALVIFALTWLVRAVGDLGRAHGLAWLSWLSPLGWVRLTRAFAGEQWWVFTLFVALAAGLAATAFALSARRDLAAGLLPVPVGPAGAAPGLRSPGALAWRLQRGGLLGWSAAAAGFGLLLGIVGVSMSGFVNAPQMQAWAQRMGARDAGDAFLFVTMFVLGQVVSVYAIMTALRMRSEEVEGRADAILATAVSRLRWALSHVTIAVIGPAVLLVVLGTTIGLGYGLTANSLSQDLPRLLQRTMSTLPAIWVMAGIAVALYGWLPRFAAMVTWGAFVLFLMLELGWELQRVSQSLFNLSPFAHVHWSIQVTAAPLLGLTVLAAALAALGLVGLQRRDIG